MPQARLPDINTAFIVYRREAISSLKSRNYDSCFGSLYALNGLLPKEYRITISTLEYNEKVKQELIVICSHCNNKIDYKEIKVFEVLAPMIVGMVTGNEYEKLWFCPKCQKENKLAQTEMTQIIPKEPYFLKIVPKPPERRDGLTDRSAYHRKVSNWVWNFLDEFEAQAAQFRDDNWTKTDLYDQDLDIDTSGESND